MFTIKRDTIVRPILWIDMFSDQAGACGVSGLANDVRNAPLELPLIPLHLISLLVSGTSTCSTFAYCPTIPHRNSRMARDEAENAPLMEKGGRSDSLPLAVEPEYIRPAQETNRMKWLRRVTVSTLILLILYIHPGTRGKIDEIRKPRQPSFTCEQMDPLFPKVQTGDLKDVDSYIASDGFRNASILRLSGAVQIPTISYDDMGDVGDDDRFEIFFKLEEYFEKQFPLVHSVLKKENVNTHGLLYTWQGADSSLKPVILMGHQDVVPVEKSTIGFWTHPPFSGYYDGTHVWGRGASDCKNQVIAIYESIETLLKAGFQPQRTVLVSFGFDEEVSGPRGARPLAQFIEKRYGKDSIAAILDEGANFGKLWGDTYALPAVGEKGYIDVDITVHMKGGHSSVPPPHTGIGVISQVISAIESSPYHPYLYDSNPYLGALQCGARYSKSFPKKLKHLLQKRQHRHSIADAEVGCSAKKHIDPLAEVAATESPMIRYLMQTSQAVDVINGGAKVNALPETVKVTVNHRINIGESVESTQRHIARIVSKVAEKHHLTLSVFAGPNATIHENSIELSMSEDHVVAPAPSTPLDTYMPGTKNLSPFAVLAGTVRSVYGESMKVSPALMTGNTDTRWYWSLSRHIFRWVPAYDPEDEGFGNIHTVNEKQSVMGHVNAVKWFTTWIRNADEASF